jgi:sensor domain CHASE-containing protein
MLAENKTGEYFKYAIGEIILVVLGILIALQINNWNENRIVQKQTYNQLLEVQNEILQNILEFDYKGNYYNEKLRNLRRFFSDTLVF